MALFLLESTIHNKTSIMRKKNLVLDIGSGHFCSIIGITSQVAADVSFTNIKINISSLGRHTLDIVSVDVK